ncbi:fluoride efflux transporter CrcB [Bacillus sp. B1-b2]|uniref:fluoride efflux transporter CrcB n=1 Tax=Bacillus sp. B1-b2 TaxID=2653201 RepID=UPI0012628B40|nr:fluoride efflux transporter CrcB [Bacillus sp. B1-b2]KAB7671133.1 fluoride efflux transporter CrcB [Bacillus sp. B1-b2]
MKYVYIGIGGTIGSIARYLVTSIPISASFPFQTMMINLIGSFLLGWLTSAIITKQKWREELSSAIGTGIIGSFTTLSTFSFDAVKLLEKGQIVSALIYIFCSVVFGLVCAFIGLKLGEKGRKEHIRNG